MVNVVLVERGHAGLRNGVADPSATPGKESPYIASLGRRIQEEEFNQPVKDFLISELKRCNIHVVDITPTADDISLSARVAKANKVYAEYCAKYGKENVNAVFVSIHFNAYDGTFTGPNPSGFGVYVNTGDSVRNSGKLARYIIEELKNGTSQVNRGLKEAAFYVLRNTNMPAVLSENGFMDNPTEALLMVNKEFQKEVAIEHAKGICKYFGIDYIKPVNQKVNIISQYYNEGSYGLKELESFLKAKGWDYKKFPITVGIKTEYYPEGSEGLKKLEEFLKSNGWDYEKYPITVGIDTGWYPEGSEGLAELEAFLKKRGLKYTKEKI